TFHQVQPTATGGSEVDVIARVARPPRSYLRHLVGSVVIHHQTDVKAAGQIRFDVLEKSQKLLMPVPPVATADRYAAGNIHGREQGSDSVPFHNRATGARARPARAAKSAACDSTPGPDSFRLAQHDRAIGRIQVPAHDVAHFLNQLRVWTT